MVVVLPAPLGPRNPCTSPVRTSRSSPSRARVGPKVFTSPEIEIAVDIGVFTASFPRTALAVHRVQRLRLFHKVVKLTARKDRGRGDRTSGGGRWPTTPGPGVTTRPSGGSSNASPST